MKVLLPYFLLLLFNGSSVLSAQITRANNALRIGDKIVKQQIPFVDPGGSGQDEIWNLCGLSPSDQEYTIEYLAAELINDSIYIMGCDTFDKKTIPAGELIVALEHYTAYYYHQQDSCLNLLGYENPLTLVHYKHPFCQMRYPLDTLRFIDEVYQTKTFYSSEKSYGTEGFVQTLPDASGSLILPSGDTLSHVIRIKTIRTCLSDTQDSISLPPLAMETYKWYAAGYRYPILESIRIKNQRAEKAHNVFETSFFYPPEEHLYIEDDVPNLALQDKQENPPVHEKNESNTGKSNSWNLRGTGWACGFYPNPVESRLNIDYRIYKDIQISIALYDSAGRILRKLPVNQLAGQYSEYLDLSTLQAGTYILYVNCGEEQKSEIIIKK